MQEKSDKISEISERITKLIDALGVNPNSFALALGYNRSQTIYDILNGKSAPSYTFFNKLANSEYSEIINMDWLLTGRGEIFNTKITNNTINLNDGQIDGQIDGKRKLHISPSIVSDISASSNGRTYQGTQEKEPLTPTGIPLSQVKAKIYATHSDEEIKETIATMTERQIIEMYEDGRIYPRKAVEQLMSALQDANLKLQSEITELKAEIRRLQLNNTPQKETQVETKK